MPDVILLILGFGLLYLGGDWIVNGVRDLALRFGFPMLVVSIAVIGFGTSAPELFVSIAAMDENRPDIAVGNVIGSNIANLLLVLAAVALFYPVTTSAKILRQDGAAALGAMILCLVTAWGGLIERVEGLMLIVILMLHLTRRLRGRKIEAGDEQGGNVKRALFFAITGLLTLHIGSHLFVESAAMLARGWGISEAVIGLSVVAVGTSLPELAACIAAARKKQADIITGNILGSNLFNSTAVIGVAALYRPVDVAPRFLSLDFLLSIAIMIIILLLMRTNNRLGRLEALILLIGYALYIKFIVAGDMRLPMII